MLQRKMILTTLSIICLSACRIPEIDPVERCAIYLRTTIEDSVCVCHQYKFDVIGGKVFPPNVDMPLKYCDRGVVFNTNDDGAWETIVNWRDEVMRLEEDR